MAMRTETALRFPAWLVVALVVVGAGLGLWQVGVFDRSTNGGSGASASANAGQSRALAVTPATAATAGESASAGKRAHGAAQERPVPVIGPMAGDREMQDRAESDALQAALAAEQASR